MRCLLSAALVAAISLSANAQTPIYFGPQIGTFGAGASVELGLGVVSISGEAGFVPVNSVTYEQNGTEYVVDMQTISGLLLVNAGLGASRFTVGVGLFFGGLSGDGASEELRGSVDVGDNTYSAAQVGSIEVAFDYGGVAPAAMFGLRGAGFNFGLGVALTGKPTYTMTSTGSLQNNPQFTADLAIDETDVQDVLDNIPLMPMLRIGYQFGVGGR